MNQELRLKYRRTRFGGLEFLLSALLLAGCQAELRGAGSSVSTSETTPESGTLTDQGNWNMNTTAFPGAGYYSGLTSTITTTNVCTGTSIFGAAGAAVCQSGTSSTPAGAANILATYEAWDATGAKVTGSMSNQGALDASASFPGAGYYNGTVNNLPIASQIVSGNTILGVAGGFTGSFPQVMASLQHRDAATTQVTLETEVVTNAATVYTNADPGYRAIPRIDKDDDGSTGGSVTAVSRTGWDTSCDGTGATGAGGLVCKCGLSGTIPQRIADCAAHGTIGANATWNGATQGNAGQGVWKLVTRTGSWTSAKGREVWQDQRTMLLWSSKVSTSLTWCKAAGSNNIAGNPVAQNDLAISGSDYCGNASYQNTTGQAVSACFEDDGTYFTQTDAGMDSGGKGGLGRTSTPVVGWRLPTRYDYQLADIHGIRFVMPDMMAGSSGSDIEWSASVQSSPRSYAFYYDGYRGRVYSNSRAQEYSVRCVGR